MSQLSSEQVAELAKQFFSVGKTLATFREQHWESLTTEQHQRLSKMQWSIYNYTDDLLALSAVIALDEMEDTLDQITHVTKEVNEFIQREQDVDKVIGIAARVVVLGGAVVSQSPLAIVSTLADLAAHL